MKRNMDSQEEMKGTRNIAKNRFPLKGFHKHIKQ